MSATLFDLPEYSAGGTVAAYRARVDRVLAEAIEEVERVERWPGEIVEVLKDLAEDGDTSWARSRVLEELDLDQPGAGRVMDVCMENINLIGSAVDGLRRAERRSYKQAGR